MKTFTYTTRCKTILGDLHTPVSTYLKVRDIFPQSALMESSDYHQPFFHRTESCSQHRNQPWHSHCHLP